MGRRYTCSDTDTIVVALVIVAGDSLAGRQDGSVWARDNSGDRPRRAREPGTPRERSTMRVYSRFTTDRAAVQRSGCGRDHRRRRSARTDPTTGTSANLAVWRNSARRRHRPDAAGRRGQDVSRCLSSTVPSSGRSQGRVAASWWSRRAGGESRQRNPGDNPDPYLYPITLTSAAGRPGPHLAEDQYPVFGGGRIPTCSLLGPLRRWQHSVAAREAVQLPSRRVSAVSGRSAARDQHRHGQCENRTGQRMVRVPRALA